MFVFICVKITDLIYENIELFWYRYFVYKMTTNFTEQIASWKHTFWFYFFSSVYLCQSYKYISVLLSILQILRGHMSILWHEDEKDMRMYVKYTVPTLNDPEMTFNPNRKNGTKTFLNH